MKTSLTTVTTAAKQSQISQVTSAATTHGYPSYASLRLTAFDILERAHNEIAALAASCGIDYAQLKPLICEQKNGYTHGIALDKSYRGKVKAWVSFHSAKNGLHYPVLVFQTFRHGGRKVIFNGYEWLEGQGYFQRPTLLAATQPAPQATPASKIVIEIIPNALAVAPLPLAVTTRPYISPAIATKPTPLPQPIAAYDLAEFSRRLERFNRFDGKFKEGLEDLRKIEAGTYLHYKGFRTEHLEQVGLVIKQGQDARGKFIAFALQNSSGTTTGYQVIYDRAFVDSHGVSRNKDFIFKPLAVEGEGIVTGKKGSYAFVGQYHSQADTVYIVEGLATAISVWLATGKLCFICLDAGNLRPVTQELVALGYQKIVLAADNDVNAKDGGNVGLFSALQAVGPTNKGNKIKIAYPQLDGKKCDFNDVHQAKGLEVVAQQLQNQELTTAQGNGHGLDYYLALIRTVPTLQLESVLEQAVEYLEHCRIPTKAEAKALFRQLMQAVRTRPGVNLKKLKKLLRQAFDRNLMGIYWRSTITDYSGVTPVDMSGKDPEAVRDYIAAQGSTIVVDTRRMGVGKTEMMRLLAEDYRKDILSLDSKVVIYLCHRRSLTSAASYRLELDYYSSIMPGKKFSSLAACINSILKYRISGQVGLLFIDEVRQTLEHVLNGSCENREEVLNELVAAIRAAQRVVMADADSNQPTLEWIKAVANKPIQVLTEQRVQLDKTIHLLDNHNAVLIHAKQALLQGENIWISTDSLTQAQKTDHYLQPNAARAVVESDPAKVAELTTALLADTGLAPENILLVTAENRGDPRQAAFLANPNEESKKYRIVIHTPVISSGISITHNHFSRIYGMFSNVLAPHEMLQSIARVRAVAEIVVSFKTHHVNNRPTGLNDLMEGNDHKASRYLANEYKTGNDEFDRLRLSFLVERHKALNNYIPEFLILAQLKGYLINKDGPDGRWVKIPGLSKEAKAKTVAAILNATPVDEQQAHDLRRQAVVTQQISNELHRYNVTELTGLPHLEIEAVDVQFYLNNGVSVVTNHELANTMDLIPLKAADKVNHATKNKVKSETSCAMIFQMILLILMGRRIDHKVAIDVCQLLQAHHKEIAINGLGNYKRVSRYGVQQLNQFVKKFGYELVLVNKLHDSTRYYQLQVNPQVARYVANRANKVQGVAADDFTLERVA